MNIFELLGQLVQWFGKLIPRLEIVPTTHGAIKFVRGKRMVAGGPGLWVYLPLVTLFLQVPTTTQTYNLATQTLTTKDGKSVKFSMVVAFRVTDVELAATKALDFMDRVQDNSLKSATKIVHTHTFEYLRDNLTEKVEKQLTTECRKYLKPFGIYVDCAFASDVAEATVLCISGDLGSAAV